MIRFLLDTDVLSEPTKPYPDPGVMRRLALDSDKSCTAAVVWMELLYGVLRLPEGRKRHRLGSYVVGVSDRLQILNFDRRAAEWLAKSRVLQARRGITRPKYDAMVAATAVRHDLTLVTGNMADYADFPGLTVERWHS